MFRLLAMCLIISMLPVSTPHYSSSYSEFSKDCISHLLSESRQRLDFELAGKEIGIIRNVSEPVDQIFFNPHFGAKLFRIQNKTIAYALIFKCNSEIITEVLMKHDRDYDPSSDKGFRARLHLQTEDLRIDAKRKYGHERLSCFTFVRDPLSHFISGLTESHFRALRMGSHPANTSTYRKKIKERTADVSGVRDILTAIIKSDKRYIKNNLDHLQHYGIQSRAPYKWKANFIGHLENFTADWQSLNRYLGTDIRLRNISIVHPTSDDPMNFKKSLLELFSEDVRYLRAVCRLVMVDFECLGYSLPPACADMTTGSMTSSATVSRRMNSTNTRWLIEFFRRI